MPITVACPGCSSKLNAPDSAAGKKVKCPRPGCGTVMLVPAPLPPEPAFEVIEDEPPAPPPKSKPAFIPAVVAEDEDNDRPKKKRRDDDEDDDRLRSRRRRYDDDDDDDDDRPRKKKKKKKGGMGAGLIVAIVLGGILVLGGIGYGIYALVGGGKAAVPKGWVEYTSKEDKFKAYYPETPKSSSFPALKEGVESMTIHMSGTLGGNKTVGVFVFKFSSGSTAAQRDKVMDDMRSSFAKDSGGKASEPRSVRWAGHKAQEVVFEETRSAGGKKGGGGVIRYFATDTHAYIGIIGGESGRLKREEEDGFFDNFQLLD